jgi:hypothetical protein
MAIDGYCQYSFDVDMPVGAGVPTLGTEVT